MPTELPKRFPAGTVRARTPRSAEAEWALASLSIPVLIVLLMASVPAPLVLPALAAISVVAGLCIAAHSCLRRAVLPAVRERLRDAAGLLILMACGASMMTDVPAALAAFAEIEAACQGAAGPHGSR